MHSGSPLDPSAEGSKGDPELWGLRGEESLAKIMKITLVFHYLLSSVWPKQLCTLAHLGLGCIHKVGTYLDHNKSIGQKTVEILIIQF